MAATLRPGQGGMPTKAVSVPETERQHSEAKRVDNADAAFAKPEIYDALELRRRGLCLRMPGNMRLELELRGHPNRPPGRPSCVHVCALQELGFATRRS